MEKYKGRIVNIEKHQNRGVYLKQGVKKPNQYKYDNYPGGNGTYVTGGEYYGTVLNVKIFVYDFDKCITFNVYDDILAIAGKKKLSAQLLSIIKSHEENKVYVYSDDGNNFSFDSRILLS
jgi:hypothetical protein